MTQVISKRPAKTTRQTGITRQLLRSLGSGDQRDYRMGARIFDGIDGAELFHLNNNLLQTLIPQAKKPLLGKTNYMGIAKTILESRVAKLYRLSKDKAVSRAGQLELMHLFQAINKAGGVITALSDTKRTVVGLNTEESVVFQAFRDEQHAIATKLLTLRDTATLGESQSVSRQVIEDVLKHMNQSDYLQLLDELASVLGKARNLEYATARAQFVDLVAQRFIETAPATELERCTLDVTSRIGYNDDSATGFRILNPDEVDNGFEINARYIRTPFAENPRLLSGQTIADGRLIEIGIGGEVSIWNSNGWATLEGSTYNPARGLVVNGSDAYPLGEFVRSLTDISVMGAETGH